MPRTAPAVKKAAVQGYGAKVIECEPTLADRERVANHVVMETGATLIPPFDHPAVIAGQGTAALELVRQVPDLGAVVVPVGGGGMLSGYCIALRGAKPAVQVYGAEPSLAGDAAASLALGSRQPALPPKSIADGLLTNLGELTWPIIRQQVRAIPTVREDEIIAAMKLVWERMKLVIEPSAAVGVAVVLSEAFRALELPGTVAVVLCGGNVNLDQMPW
jgi:threonine dehydratase/serine racemase